MDLSLTQAEKDSALGRKIIAHYEERLLEARKKNDGRMDQEDRDALIAKIRELKSMIRAFTTDVMPNPMGSLVKDVELPE